MSKLPLLFACAALLPAAQDRILTPVDPARTVRMQGHVHPRALTDSDQGAVDPALAIDHATLLLRPAAGLSLFLAAQQMPGSSDYRRTLTPEQFGERFGLSAGDMAKVVAWLESQGLRVEEIARGRHWITFSGTAAQAARTFRTPFHRFVAGGRTHFANTTEPAIPAALEAVVAGFTGLNDFPTHVERALPQTNLSDGSHAISPDDLATIYNVAPLYASGIDGTGQRIAIAGEVNLNLADIRSFRTTFGLPANDPDVVLVGRDPGPNANALIEAALDVEWSGAVARNAKIVYVYASDVFTAARYAIDQKVAPVLSLSFGACEAYTSLSFRAIAQQANAEGITFLTSSGDWSAAICDVSSPVPQAAKGARGGFPASIPEVTGVGGTTFNEGASRYWAGSNSATKSSALSYIPEVAWNEAVARGQLLASGGGPSAYFTKPFWQTGPGVPADGMRDTPDVSLTSAIDHDPYLVVSSGTLLGVGGTSAAAPSFAGIVALLNQSLVSRKLLDQPGVGNINPTLYHLAQSAPDAFHDITSGDNFVSCLQGTADCSNGALGYAAAPGYDMATGLGSVDAARLIAAWNNGDATTTTVSANPASAGANDTISLSATVTGKRPAPGGTVTFVTSLDTMLGAAPLSGGTATLSVSAQAVLAGDGKVYALYSGDAVYGSSAGSVTLTATPPASGSLVFVTLTPNPTATIDFSGQAPLTIVLTERAGVATRLTSVTAGGSNLSLTTFFGGGAIAAGGTLTSAAIVITPNIVPSDIPVHFAGQDASGATWTRDLTLHVTSSPGAGLAPGIALTSSPVSVAQNPRADTACQWSHQLTLRETAGYYVTLSDPSNTVQQLFGTTRLAPFGSLTAAACATATGSKQFAFTGATETGAGVSASLTVTYTAALSAPAAFTVSAPSVQLAVPDSNATDSASLDVSVAGFTLSARPAWLAASVSGTRVTFTASSAGLSRGVYNATVFIQTPNGLPQSVAVPVTFVVGASTTTSIAGVAHGASFKQSFAPGMILSVFGAGLAPATIAAASLPLPFSLAGVSATVNGITAPLYFISPGQLNVQVPYEAGAGAAVLAVNNNGAVASFPFQISVAAPGTFTTSDGLLVPNSSAKAGDTVLAFVTGDGDQTPTLATGATPAVSRFPKSRMPVTVTVGGVSASIAFNGIPNGLAGVTQINFTVPAGVPSGPQDVIVTVGTIPSPPAKIVVK